VVLVTEIDGQSTENEGNFPLAALLVLGATDGSPVTLHILYLKYGGSIIISRVNMNLKKKSREHYHNLMSSLEI
jgi:hypothetical protein